MGVLGVSSSSAFWLVRAGRAWAWTRNKPGRWIEEALPPPPKDPRGSSALLKALIPTQDRAYFVVRDQNEPANVMRGVADTLGWYGRLAGDSIYYSTNKSWNCVSNTATKFFTLETVATLDKGYLRTTAGDLFEVSALGVSKLEAPGFCQALASTANGRVLAVFRGQGIFQLDGRWRRLLGIPFSDTGGNYLVLLAGQEGRVALALHPLPKLVGTAATYISEPGLWVSDAGEWKRCLQ